MTKVIKQTYNAVYEHGTRFTYILLLTCVFCMTIYLMNVYKIISNTVALENVQKQTASITSTVDSLDSQYLELSSKITPDNLKGYGLTQSKVSAYVFRSASLGSVAVSGHEL